MMAQPAGQAPEFASHARAGVDAVRHDQVLASLRGDPHPVHHPAVVPHFRRHPHVALAGRAALHSREAFRCRLAGEGRCFRRHGAQPARPRRRPRPGRRKSHQAGAPGAEHRDYPRPCEHPCTDQEPAPDVPERPGRPLRDVPRALPSLRLRGKSALRLLPGRRAGEVASQRPPARLTGRFAYSAPGHFPRVFATLGPAVGSRLPP